jgi:hypothetical protein
VRPEGLGKFKNSASKIVIVFHHGQTLRNCSLVRLMSTEFVVFSIAEEVYESK